MTDWTPGPLPEAKRHTAPARGARGYAAAQFSRLFSFSQSLEPAHRELQRNLLKLRAHSRDLAANNAYMRRYVGMVMTHVVGPDGITFESEITGNQNKPKKDWNDTIEDAWKAWGRAVSVDGETDWIAFQQRVASTVATDGECLIRKVPGFRNSCRFALEIIDADRLDWQFNQSADVSGTRIVMGVEMDAWGRRIAYHIFTQHPYDFEARPKRERIPAEQIIHVRDEERSRATRGVPWATGVMVQLNMLGKLWTAELGAATWESRKVATLRTQQGVDIDSFASDDLVSQAAELSTEDLTILAPDPGTQLEFPPIQHPNSAFPDFSRYLLKGIAAGLGVSYHSLAADVSDANYSSARVALLEERDTWRRLQGWFIRTVCEPIFRAWLEMAIASGAIHLPVLEIGKLCAPRWWPRSWDWIDPEKDAKASILAIRSGLSTYQAELGALGKDYRDVFAQRAVEEQEQKDLGLHLELDMGKGGQGIPADPADPAQDGGGSTPAKGGGANA